MEDKSPAAPHVSGVTRSIRRPPPPRVGKKRRHLPFALLSLVIGTLMWFGIDYKRMEDDSLDLDVEFLSLLPADWKFVSQSSNSVRLALRGTRQDLTSIRKEEVSIEPDFPTGALEGDAFDGTLTLRASQVRGLPPGIEVRSITPPVIQLRLVKIVTKYITVEPGDIVGSPADGYVVGKVHQIDPPAMPVSVPSSLVPKIGSGDVIRTKEFSVAGSQGMVGGMVGLEPFVKDGQRIEVPGLVYMAVEVVETPAQRQFEQPFEVRALIDSPFDSYANLNISPPSVKVTVSGPKSVVDNMNPGEVVIYADMRDRIPAAPGEFNIKCKAITPSRVRVTRIEPDTVKWLTREAAPAPMPSADYSVKPLSGFPAGK